ncbi:uncharacterized protein AB675_2504 [Cyphellophora attinorum]|uniref:Uncharacterized protein n=1 Tax=Cyphellophora attinorum TaxID=1664694 RepID=A0A0N1HHD3_9EURO|nr:uncharacterized protein AB675_2504 [Phialophora attinorum]KPI45362.1 hypothetical protein AB675_2504 [Phialophora attinorum]
MAAPALGVGDIVKAAKLTYDGVGALREDEDGARAHFQQATTAIAHRTRAVEDLISDLKANTGGSNQAALEAYAPLLAEDTALQTKIARLGPSLGRGAKPGLHHGMGRKLKFHFEDDKQIREHHERTRPAVDAAVLQTLRASTQVVKDLHAKQSTRFDGFVTNLDRRLDALDPTPLHDKINVSLDEVKQMFATLNSASSGCSSTSFQPQTPGANASLLPTAGSVSAKQGSLAAGHPRSLSTAASLCSTPRGADQTQISSGNSHLPCFQGHWTQTKAGGGSIVSLDQPLKEEALKFLIDWLAVLYALTAVVAYQQPQARRIVIRQLEKAREDPFLGALLGCLVIALIRSLAQVHRQIMSLADDNITVHYALGEQLGYERPPWWSDEEARHTQKREIETLIKRTRRLDRNRPPLSQMRLPQHGRSASPPDSHIYSAVVEGSEDVDDLFDATVKAAATTSPTWTHASSASIPRSPSQTGSAGVSRKNDDGLQYRSSRHSATTTRPGDAGESSGDENWDTDAGEWADFQDRTKQHLEKPVTSARQTYDYWNSMYDQQTHQWNDDLDRQRRDDAASNERHRARLEEDRRRRAREMNAELTAAEAALLQDRVSRERAQQERDRLAHAADYLPGDVIEGVEFHESEDRPGEGSGPAREASRRPGHSSDHPQADNERSRRYSPSRLLAMRPT